MEKIICVGNAHIDPVWLWNKEEGLAEIKSTFRSALDRMQTFPDYYFTSACASYYKWIRDNAPDLFAEVKEKVADGKIQLAGGMWVQPDCNIPSGESFNRHLLYSQRFFQENLGCQPDFGYNVDSFGHNGMLPQLLQRAGVRYYVFMRPSPAEKPNLPENTFWWEAPDGSRVLTCRLLTYGAMVTEEDFAVYRAEAERTGLPVMLFYGVGNHGGGPTVRQLQAIERERDEQVVYGTPDTFFEDAAVRNADLRVVREDLQHHASGCYSANASIKALNRRAENLLLSAERMDTLANALLGTACSTEKLGQAWQAVLFNQFHDILAGCSIRSAYEEADWAMGSACHTAMEVRHAALQHISWAIDTKRGAKPVEKMGWRFWEVDGEGAPVVIFNPHSFPVKTLAQINNRMSGAQDADGNPLRVQHIRGPQTNGADDHFNTLVQVEVPPMGYRTVYVYQNQVFGSAMQPNTPSAHGLVLENGLLRAEFDPATGTIARLTDLRRNRLLNAAPMALPLVIDDTQPDTWAHNLFTFNDVVGRFGSPEIRVLENGPLRAGIRVTSRYGASVLRQDFLLEADSAELQVRCLLHNHETLKRISLSFPAAIESGEAVYSMQFGSIAKSANGQEEPMQMWAAVRGADGETLAVLNDCKYSANVQKTENGTELRMTIARSCGFADHYGVRDELLEYQDQGEQCIRYSIVPQVQFSATELHQRSAVLNMELPWVAETHHEGKLPHTFSGLTIDSDHCQLEAVKAAEDGDGTILRLWETAGTDAGTVRVTFCGKAFEASLSAYEFRTYRLRDDGTAEEVLTTEYQA